MAKLCMLLATFLIVFAIGATSVDTESTSPETPGSPTTTKAPTTPTTTKAPATTTTTKAPGSTNSPPTTPTGSPATTVTGATKPPTTTTVPTTTESPNACVSNPCFGGSTCEPRADETFVCLCLTGESYNEETQSCQRALAFPGQLALERTFEPSMSDKSSAKFKELSDEIVAQVNKDFKAGTLKEEYSSCLVLELRKRPGTRASLKAGDKVDASIDIFFKANSKVTKENVLKEMENAAKCSDCVLKDSSFDSKSLCNSKPCDEVTTKCEPGDGFFTCSCQKDYIPTAFSDRICLACPSGEKSDGSNCVPCEFGYTGLNCEDDRLLAVVIAASVLGALLLIALIVIPIVAVKMKKKGSKKNKNEDIGKPYVSHSIAKTTPAGNNGVSNAFNGSSAGVAATTGVPHIPRATGGSNWDNKTNLEMTPSNSHQHLISSGRNAWMNDDEDDTFKFGQSRPQTNHYEPTRPQTNHYEPTRPQQNHYAQSPSVNPYAQRHSNSNPYYMSDDDRYGR